MNKSINLFGQIFEIKYIHECELSDRWGEILISISAIRIANHLSKLQRLSSLIANINHCCIKHKGLHYILDKNNIDYICDMIGSGIASVLINNNFKLFDKTDSINICGQKYQIENVDEDIIEAWGVCCIKKNRIYMTDGVNGFESMRIKLHETIHAIIQQSGIKEIINDGHIEMICEVFSYGWTSIYFMNPDLEEILRDS